MSRTSIIVIFALVLQQYIQITQGGKNSKYKIVYLSFDFIAICATNPCQLIAGVFDSFNGYCCYDIPGSYGNALCTCPNNIQSVVNAPCRKKILDSIHVYFFFIQALVTLFKQAVREYVLTVVYVMLLMVNKYVSVN